MQGSLNLGLLATVSVSVLVDLTALTTIVIDSSLLQLSFAAISSIHTLTDL